MNLKYFEKPKFKNINLVRIATTRSKINLGKFNILLGIYRRRERFNEFKTARAVENCRRLVSEEIERFIKHREKTIINIFPDLIKDRKNYSQIFNNNDLEMIYRKTESIITNEFFKRFNGSIIWRPKKENSADWISNIFSPVQKYQATKKRTVLITSYMEALSRKTLGDSVESLIRNSLLAKLVCNIDISTILLPKLGINSDLETMELNDALINRISGALYSIKIGLIQEMNNQIANIFYETHDLQSYTALERKIQLLEDKIAIEEIYEIDLLEA